MHTSLKALLHTARNQVLGRTPSRIWTATTASGKVVVIDGDRVVKVVDPTPRRQTRQKGGHV